MIKYDKLEAAITLTIALIMVICITGCKKKDDEFNTNPKYVLKDSEVMLS